MPTPIVADEIPALDSQLLDTVALDAEVAASENIVKRLQQALADADDTLAARFLEGTPASELVPLRAEVMDAIVWRLWPHFLGTYGEQACLVAVGGYGRG